MYDALTSPEQVRAIRKEFEEALQDHAWTLAARIIQANPGIMTKDDRRRLLEKRFGC